MRILVILILISLIFVLFQVSSMPVFGLYTDIVLAYLLTIVFHRRLESSVNVAFSAGIFLDSLGSTNFGVFTLLYTVFSILSLYIFNFFGNRFIALPILTFIFFNIEAFLLGGILSFKVNIIFALITALFSCLLYPLISFICAKFGSYDDQQVRMKI